MIEKAVKAGKVAAKARDAGVKLVKPGAKVLEIAEFVEEKIRKAGCGVAFPVNISINEIAAHDTAKIGDERIIRKGDLVKLDVGVHVDGVIADTARTAEAGSSESAELVKCVEEGLEKALSMVKPGNRVNVVGEAVQAVADSYGFSVVKNLVGHGLGNYNVHTGVSIPNYRNNDRSAFKEGMLVALEPYVTSGNGLAISTGAAEIYSLKQVKPVRIRKARQLLDWVVNERRTLPFCKRWLRGYGGQLDFILKTLVRQGILTKYGVLKEKSGKKVSQAEHTVLVLDEPITTTKID
jgi:methionyl aminopeptidase